MPHPKGQNTCWQVPAVEHKSIGLHCSLIVVILAWKRDPKGTSQNHRNIRHVMEKSQGQVQGSVDIARNIPRTGKQCLVWLGINKIFRYFSTEQQPQLLSGRDKILFKTNPWWGQSTAENTFYSPTCGLKTLWGAEADSQLLLPSHCYFSNVTLLCFQPLLHVVHFSHANISLPHFLKTDPWSWAAVSYFSLTRGPVILQQWKQFIITIKSAFHFSV